MKPKLYLETTIPSYLTAWPSRDLRIAAHQQITHDWWLRRRNHFQLFISQFVTDEISVGDKAAAAHRLVAIKAIPILEITEDVLRLNDRILASNLIPRRAAHDAAHIAISTVHEMDFLMTWNCAHLANAEIADRIAEICLESGYTCPRICTPEVLIGD